MNEQAFDQSADQTLRDLVTALDEVDDVECELSQGVLKVFLPGDIEYVINSHRAAGQIWMAAGRCAWHFSPDDAGARWASTKPPHEELWAALSATLEAALGRPLRLSAPSRKPRLPVMDAHLKELWDHARRLYERADFVHAEPLLEQVAASSEHYADAFEMLGIIAHARGDVALAELRFKRAVAINPNYTEALLNLAITYNDQQKYVEARSVFDTLRARQPAQDAAIEPFARGKLANMHAALGQAYADVQQTRDAIEQLERAIALCPTFVDLQTTLGVLYLDAGDLDRAREAFHTAGVVNPRFARAHVLLGTTLLALGDVEGAREAWQKALSVEPTNARALSYLAMLERRRSCPPNGSVFLFLLDRALRSLVTRLRANLRRAWAAAFAEHSSPVRVGVALGLGAFVGMSPLVGLHSLIALALASFARLNRMATLAGTNLSFGPILPVVVYAEIDLGARLLGHELPRLSTMRSPFHASGEILAAWCTGFAVLGPSVAGVVGLVGYAVARSRQQRS